MSSVQSLEGLISNQWSLADPNVGTSQSEVSDNQANLAEGNPTEDSEGADGVSSEGEKQAVGVEVRKCSQVHNHA